MRKRMYSALLMILCLLSFASCDSSPPSKKPSARAVYFLTQTEHGRELSYEVVSFDDQKDLEGRIADVIEAMKNPVNENNTSLIPHGVELSQVQVFGSTVVVRFSEQYASISAIESSLLSAGVTLSLTEMDEISYVRVTGGESRGTTFMSSRSLVLDDGDLRLTAFEVTVYLVDRETGRLVPRKMRILTEEDELTPEILLYEMINGQLGGSAPFDGRMDVRGVTLPNEEGTVRVDVYVPVEMDLTGREADIYSIVNTLFECRGVRGVTVTINGSPPSDRKITGCDGVMKSDSSYLG